MASEKGSIATEDPLLTAPGLPLPPAVTSQTGAQSSTTLPEPSRQKSLKRYRETTPTSPTSTSNDGASGGTGAGSGLGPAPGHNPLASPTKAARLGFSSSRRSPVPLTGAAELEEQRRRREEEERQIPPGHSDNPIHSVLSALAGSATSAMSRPTDAPAHPPPPPPQQQQQQPPTTAPSAVDAPSSEIPHSATISAPSEHAHNHSSSSSSEINNTAANHTNTNNNSNGAITGDTATTSPQSASAASAVSATGPVLAASPTPMDVDSGSGAQERPAASAAQLDSAQDDRPAPASLSYPGTLHNNDATPTPSARNMSYPSSSSMAQESPGHSSGKKHKCPDCDTEFTRHHNLKSHLLTHSQEKPFVCEQCDARFRRLHDLKRHTKLHTGEKPHICPKCNRKFARGDALARHARGPGGCAGKRGSGVGGWDVEDGSELNDSVMTDDTSMDRSAQGQLGQSRTYPPTSALERPPGGLYPPPVPQDRGPPASNASHSAHNSLSGGQNSNTNTSGSSVPVGGAASSMYSQTGGLTESPKPLSPSATHDSLHLNRQRSPSLSQQVHHYGQRPSDRHTPPGTAFPPTAPSSSAAAATAAAAHARTSSGSYPGAGGSHPGVAGSDHSGNVYAPDPGMWSYVQQLEEKLKQLSESVSAMQRADSAKQAQIGLLTTDVTALKKQLEASENESSARQAQVGLLTAELTDVKKYLHTSRDGLTAESGPAKT